MLSLRTRNASMSATLPAPVPLYPLHFRPLLKRLIWGGRRLGMRLGKPIGPENDYAESWEIADHRADVSVVADGPLAGTTLRSLIRDRAEELLGPSLAGLSQFPLLVKFLDAHDVLSVQVHPDDTLARRLVDDNGKTEAWVIVHADPGSRIYAGLQPGVTRTQFADAIARGDVEPLLHSFEPRPGDCVLIPAGTVHAIGAGIVLAEIQQMSDATFRVYDWRRLGPDGRPRSLHIDEALQATDFEAGPVNPVQPRSREWPDGTVESLVQSPYFALDRLRIREGELPVGRADRFTILMGLEGRATLRFGSTAATISLGQTVLLPAALGEGRACAEPGGDATLLTCVVP